MEKKRVSGVLLHVTSLPSYGGVGDFGPAARAFVDFLAAAKQKVWQVLPLSPTGYGSSPYSALSAFAGNPVLVSLEILADQGWIARERIAGLPGHDGAVDFGAVWEQKIPLIEEAAANFLDGASDEQRRRFQKFCNDNVSWLQDYAMYTVLRRMHGYQSWHEWPEEYARRTGDALTRVMNEHGHELAVEQCVQYFFNEQWCSLRGYCAERDVKILGRCCHLRQLRQRRCMDESRPVRAGREICGRLRVSGVPPDYFSATGQRWGNPLYRWGLMKERGFDWWVARIRRSLTLYDIIRLDHFRGFEAYWSIAADEETAINGQWVKAPGHELFQRLKDVFGELPFVAEDLGLITKEVDELREHYGMPGMRILQFGFGDRGAHLYLPHRFVPNTVTYTGTHDNNTTLGWWLDDTSPEERENVRAYLQPIEHPSEIVGAMMRAAARSVADTCIFPLQDVLHLGSEARMNTPAAGRGNWTWRFGLNALQPHFADSLAKLMEMTDRDGYEAPIEGAEAGRPTDEASNACGAGFDRLRPLTIRV